MVKSIRRAFFAYPSHPSELSTTIERAVTKAGDAAKQILLRPWPSLDVLGANIPDRIKDGINSVDATICDLTIPNQNVYYEIGFSIGAGKTIAPVVNSSFSDSISNIQKEGIFDNIGYKTYQNHEELCAIMKSISSHKLVDLYSKSFNNSQPIYFLDTFWKNDFRNSIVSSIKASKVFYRSYDPVESPRSSCINMIGEVSSSSGIIIPVLGSNTDGHLKHNLRASLLAGLSHGLGRPTLIIKFNNNSSNDPADFRDDLRFARNDDEINELVSGFALEVLRTFQNVTTPKIKREKRSDLQNLSLGSSSAENEFRSLEGYFVETAEYLRTIRGEVRIVTGRKGSGKTAIFFQARDAFRKWGNAVVTDLKPESHQLSLFRQELLSIVGAGVFDHTIASFWHFVILSEILLNIKEKFDARSKYDINALRNVRDIEEAFLTAGIDQSGDFTTRINRLGSYVVDEIRRAKLNKEILSAEKLTNIVFRSAIAPIRSLIIKFSTPDTKIVLLFDNIDKGWPSTGVDEFDVRLLRLLVESLEKVQFGFSNADRDFQSVVFIRNDIYELMVSDTPDKGKAGHVRIDWTDRAKMRHVIFRRLQNSSNDKISDFETIWTRFFVDKVGETSSFEYLLDHCLMRPRFLINVIEGSIANAVNRGNTKVQENDIVDAARQHSLTLIDDFGYEIRDVSGISYDVLYSLVGSTCLVTREELVYMFKNNISDINPDKVINLMLWYGIIGIHNRVNQVRYIYDYDYNIKRLEAEIVASQENMLYVINPGLYVGLSA